MRFPIGDQFNLGFISYRLAKAPKRGGFGQNFFAIFFSDLHISRLNCDEMDRPNNLRTETVKAVARIMSFSRITC